MASILKKQAFIGVAAVYLILSGCGSDSLPVKKLDCLNGDCENPSGQHGNSDDPSTDKEEKVRMACEDGQFPCHGKCFDGKKLNMRECDLCNTGWGNCDHDWNNGCEFDVSSDSDNCGSCEAACEPMQKCEQNACVSDCAETEVWCDGKCIDIIPNHLSDCKICNNEYADCNLDINTDGCETNLTTDASNCGGCGAQCNEGEICEDGLCVSGCQEGYTPCKNSENAAQCTDVTTSIDNCGGCDIKCEEIDGTSVVCSNGICIYQCTEEGYSNCGTDSNPKCVDLHEDIENCGQCNIKCSSLPGAQKVSCVEGNCTFSCDEGLKDCDGDSTNGCETITKTNKDNCGECSHACDLSEVCSYGKCGTECEGELKKCSDDKGSAFCADTTIDRLNCGDCNIKCTVVDEKKKSSCEDSICVFGCIEGYDNCGSTTSEETVLCLSNEDFQENNDHCGGCNRPCKDLFNVETSACSHGTCLITECTKGFTDCNKDYYDGCETDPLTDINNCGTCGNACDSQTSECVEGKCKPFCDEKECGDDGHGGSCGECSGNTQCKDNKCIKPVEIMGCSDGTREGFISVQTWDSIAACSGAWSVKGVHQAAPACNRKSGNDSDNPNGTGCNVEDLCAEGWHVCLGKDDVAAHSSTGCDGIMTDAKSPAFYLARTSSANGMTCTADSVGSSTTNRDDIFGCGDLGCGATQSSCKPLQLGSHDGCHSLKNDSNCSYSLDSNGKIIRKGAMACSWCNNLSYWSYVNKKTYNDTWECGNKGHVEAINVVKTSPDLGGVLCCKD